MKIPGARDMGVQSLAKPNIQAIGQGEGATARALAGLGKDMVSIGLQFEQDKAQAQMQEAATNFLNDDIAWRTEHEGKAFYEADELPEGIGVNLIDGEGNPRSQIPAYEVHPALYEYTMSESLKRNSGLVEMPRARNDWEAKYNQVMQRSILDSHLKSVQIQTKLNDQKSLMQAEEAASSKNYGAAEAAIRNLSDPLQQEQEMRVLKLQMETDNYDEMLMNGTPEDMRLVARNLADPVEYERYGGMMDTGGRLAYISKLESRAGALEKQGAESSKVQKAWIKKRVDAAAEAMAVHGKNLDPRELSTLMAEAQQADIAGASQVNLALAVQSSPKLNEFSSRPVAVQQTILRDMTNMAQTPEQLVELEMYQKRYEYTRQAANTDMMQLMSDRGFDVPPLDTSSPEAFVQSLASRVPTHDVGLRTYGESQGYLTSAETQTVVAMLDSSDMQGKLNMASAVTQALGPGNSAYFFEQLKGKGQDQFVVAGRLMSEGQPVLAEHMLRGNLYRKENKLALQNEKEYDHVITEELGQMYQFNGRELNMNRQAIKDLYVYRAQQNGDFSGELDDDLLEQVILEIANPIEYNGMKIQAPNRGVTEEQFSRHMDRVEPEYIEQLGGVEGVDNSLVLERLRSGMYQLINRAGGEYVISNGAGQFLAKRDTGEPFVYRYSADAPMRPMKPKGRGGVGH